MAHTAQMIFVQQMRNKFPTHFEYCEVLEVGSRNVNGTVRQFFDTCRYTGIDCVDGPCVDCVTLAHEYRPPKVGFYDTVISCSTFEHDPYLKETLTTVLGKCLRKDGLFVGSWVGPKWKEHGTIRTTGNEGIYGPDPNYYKGVSGAEFRKLASGYFKSLEIEDQKGLDVFVWGLRNG